MADVLNNDKLVGHINAVNNALFAEANSIKMLGALELPGLSQYRIIGQALDLSHHSCNHRLRQIPEVLLDGWLERDFK